LGSALLLTLPLFSVAGCSKKAEPESQLPAPAAQIESQLTPSTNQSARIEDRLNGTISPEMTMRLHVFNQMKGRLPENFYELQNMPGFDSVPPLPLNMKYVIDSKDKTVKAVKK
jgi:hypothetical protein